MNTSGKLRVSSCAIWLLLFAMEADASLTSVSHLDIANCDPLVVPQEVDELGTSPFFDNLPDEIISSSVVAAVPASVSPCPAVDDPHISNVVISITNSTTRSFSHLWYVADPVQLDNPTVPPMIGTNLSNYDGLIDQLISGNSFDGGRAFQIDKSGLNQPLLSESGTQDEIFEVGETWTFAIQDYQNLQSNPASDLGSVGVGSNSAVAYSGSTGSIIGVPVPPANPVDHFNVYNSTGPAPSITPLALTDSFGTITTAIGAAAIFMVPTDKNQEGIGDSFSHLTCYEVTDPGPVGPGVTVTNQFGTSSFSLGQPAYLCVSTEKLIDPGPVILDHYLCYEASGAETSSFVALFDQFQFHSTQVVDPLLFCNAVRIPSQVVNVDFNIGADTDFAHSGDDGVISTPGSTVWNSVLFNGSATNALDENGFATNVDVITTNLGFGTDAASGNDLQDGGVVNDYVGGGGAFEISDLVQGERYDLFVYGGVNTSFDFQTGGYTISLQCTQTPPGASYVLPGTPGGDYCQAQQPMAVGPPEPFDLGGGVFGFRISNIDGLITGFQIVRAGVTDLDGHLACYNYTPLGASAGTVPIANQFFPDPSPAPPASIEIGESFALCAPSEATVSAAQVPALGPGGLLLIAVGFIGLFSRVRGAARRRSK